MSDTLPDQNPVSPPYPEIDPGSSPQETPADPWPPQEDETGRPYDRAG